MARRPRPIKVNKALRFYHEVLGLEHLQYGLWDDEPLTLDGLRVAQERYARTLHEWIPDGVKRILDVGCGTGISAARLLEGGYEVEGLSPDPYQQTLFAERAGAPFYLARFQDFEPEKPYDLVMMSESSQYIWLDDLFPSVRRAAPGGHYLLADYFVTEKDGGALSKSGHPLEAFLAAGERHGFELERRQDVTDAVLPTLDLARGFLDRYALPTAMMAAEFVSQDHPFLYRLGRLFARPKLHKIDEAKTLADSAEFKRVKRYLFLLYKVP